MLLKGIVPGSIPGGMLAFSAAMYWTLPFLESSMSHIDLLNNDNDDDDDNNNNNINNLYYYTNRLVCVRACVRVCVQTLIAPRP